MSDFFVGQITAFGGNFAPKNWATCSNQTIAISQNTALFSILGTTYGGNGTTTFCLPDLRGRVAMGSGTGPGLTPRVLGELSGVENVTLLTTQMPAHNHALNATTAAATGASPQNTILSTSNGADGDGNPFTVQIYGPTPASTTLNPASIGIAGGSQPHNNMQPYLALTYIICIYGIYPSRN
jgi:microcystin-dependent protein